MASDTTRLALCSAVSRFLDSADLTDFTIKCGNLKWPVHRFLLCLHSDVMAKWCTGDFKEVKNGSVDLSAHESKHIHALIKYIYTFDYSEDEEIHADELSFHVTICVIADKYNITGLKDLAISKFKAIVNATDNPIDLLQCCLTAWEAATATSAIRESIVSLIHQKRATFLPNPATDDSKQLEETMRTYPDLAIEVAKSGPAEVPLPYQCTIRTYQCERHVCKYEFRMYLPSSRSLSYSCPKCSDTKNGDFWNTYCVKR